MENKMENSLDMLATVVSKEANKQEPISKSTQSMQTEKIPINATPMKRKASISVGIDEDESTDRLLKQRLAIIKEQQAALIEARKNIEMYKMSAPPASPSNMKRPAHLSITTTEPKMYKTMESQAQSQRPQMTSAATSGNLHAQTPSRANMISPGAVTPRPIPVAKADFIRFFDHTYEQSENANRLLSTLSEQVRLSATLLSTLQSSGSMIEGLVRSHFRDMQTQYGEKFGVALTDLNRRIRKIEYKLGMIPTEASPEASPKESLEFKRVSTVSTEEKVAAVEKVLTSTLTCSTMTSTD